MQHIGSETRLTDSLERELMAAAIREQMEFQPGKALKRAIQKLFNRLTQAQQPVTGQTADATH